MTAVSRVSMVWRRVLCASRCREDEFAHHSTTLVWLEPRLFFLFLVSPLLLLLFPLLLLVNLVIDIHALLVSQLPGANMAVLAASVCGASLTCLSICNRG
jgi:hypothetical protein